MLLTREECVKILKNLLNVENDQLKLVDYHIERDNSAVGFLGDYHALTLSYCTAGDETVQTQQLFVKAVPQLSDEPEKEAIFRKESLLYDTLLANMQKYSNIKWSANCYYTRPDLIVLENIKLKGYSPAAATLLTEEQLLQLLRSLAAFHVASLVYEQRKGVSIGEEFGERLMEISVASNIPWFRTGLSAVLAVLRSLAQYQTSAHIAFMDTQLPKILERIYKQVSTSSRYRNVLCHRDLWAGNVFFPAERRDPVIMVDFQTSRYSPPAIDLCFSLYLNLTTAERRRLEASCIDFYYNWLQQDWQKSGLQSNQLISKTELLQSYEEFRLIGAVYSALAITMVKVPPSFITNEYEFIDRSATILDYMKQNAEFRECMEEGCVEVMEVAMAQK